MRLSNNSIVFSDKFTKFDILKKTSDSSLFLKLKFYNYNSLFSKINNRYLFYMYKKYNYSFDLALKVVKYFDYIDLNKQYTSLRLNELKSIKLDLISKKILMPFNFDNWQNYSIYKSESSLVPKFIDYELSILEQEKLSNKPIKLSKTTNYVDYINIIYNSVIKLLENNVPIDNIILLNSSAGDEYYLSRLFNDSNIPVYSDRKHKLSDFPETQELIRFIEENGYLKVKEYIVNNFNNNLQAQVISLINNYFDSDLTEFPELLIELLQTETYNSEVYKNTINFCALDNLINDNNKHYLLLNYTEPGLISYSVSNDYLTENEIDEINYFKLDEINQSKSQSVKSLIQKLDNIELFYVKNIEQEKILPDFDYNRELIESELKDVQLNYTYFKSFDLFEFAKAKYDYDTYRIKSNEFDTLYNTYNINHMLYNHKFNGIDKADLAYLLNKYKTITGAKLESYEKCQFQFLLKHLLKLGKIKSSTSQTMGTITHKALEILAKSPKTDVMDIVLNFGDFPFEEQYKESIYRLALKQELEKFIPVFIDFHQKTKFDLIETEIQFEIPFQEFFITGTIDKAMVYNDQINQAYFILIDYKINDNDFKLKNYDGQKKLQIPTYLFAYQSKHKNMKPVGLYYQTTGLGRYKREDNAILNNYVLKGITLDNPSIVERLDPGLANLASVKLKLDGNFYSSDRIVDNDDFTKIISNVETKLNKMIEGLKSGDFEINPLISYGKKKDSLACEYCDFSNICFNKNRGLGGELE